MQNTEIKLANPSRFVTVWVDSNSLENGFDGIVIDNKYQENCKYSYYCVNFLRGIFQIALEKNLQLLDCECRVYKVDLVESKRKSKLGLAMKEERRVLLYRFKFNRKTNELEQIF